MNNHDKILLSDLNLAEYTREMTRWNLSGEVLEQDDLLLTRGSCPFPTTCVAMDLNYARDNSASETFNRIRSFYKQRNSPFSIHLRKHADASLEAVCLQQNLIPISDAPGMVVDRSLPEKPAPDGIDIRHVTDIAGLKDSAFVVRESYQSLGMPPHVCEQIFAAPERLLRPHNDWIVAYDSGRPVSTALTLFAHGIAGLYWVGTLENNRGRGLAEACVREATNAAFRRGASLVVLQASKFGAPLYRQMGFEEITRYRWYLCFKS